jgi:hypothetical protein
MAVAVQVGSAVDGGRLFLVDKRFHGMGEVAVDKLSSFGKHGHEDEEVNGLKSPPCRYHGTSTSDL